MRAASARVQSHPPTPASPPSPKPALPGFKGPPSGKRVTVSSPKPEREDTPVPPVPEKPSVRTPSIEEVENDPLVKSVLDVFEGEIKRVHPKNP